MSVLAKLREEGERLVRFGFIGGLSFLVNAAVYATLSRVVWPSGSRELENFIAGITSAVFGFFAHRWFTFRSKGRKRDQAPRFLVVTACATVFQNTLFWVGHSVLKWHDVLVFVGVNAMVPLVTYTLHRLYTFRHPAVPQAQGADSPS
jgi:putative flippase GtrA